MVRLATYNLWGYHTPAEYLKLGRLRGALPGSRAAHLGPPDRVAAARRARLIPVLSDADPDVVALQENVRRPGAEDRSHARQIGRALGMTVVEGSMVEETDRQGQSYEIGVALLTHLPIDGTDELALPYRAGDDLGGSPHLLRARLDAGDGALHVWVTHWPAKSPEAALACAGAVAEAAQAWEGSALLCGDLNSEPDSDPIRRLTSAPRGASRGPFVDVWDALRPGEDGFTMATPEPSRRLDHVMLWGDSWRASSIEILGDSPDAGGLFPSDHCGLVVTLDR